MNLFGVMILFALAPMLGLGQSPDNRTSPKEAASDRSRAGLRGPVKICVQESTYPAVTASDGRQFPERTMRIETEYDQEGRLVSTRTGNSDGPCGWFAIAMRPANCLKPLGAKKASRPR